jgi:tRNA-binding protein
MFQRLGVADSFEGITLHFLELRINSAEDSQMKYAPVKKTVSFEDFQKVDIRIGTIKSVLEVANSNKLTKLIVDFGDHTRSIIAGIKQERTNPGEIEGKQALFVINLPEKKMAGEVSQGMLFDIGYADKITPCLAVPEKPVPNGVRAG